MEIPLYLGGIIFLKISVLCKKHSKFHNNKVVVPLFKNLQYNNLQVFTWSASGNIITEALAAQMAVVVVYVMDTVRSTSPVTFMSNM